MKDNVNVKIIGKKMILVPYEVHHVSRYSEWMQSAELQILTASEPLTLQDEYRMQQSWRDDPLKGMVGDVNLFFNDTDDEHSAEVEIMIAESKARGRGIGKEALCSMMRYGWEKLNAQRYTAKIAYTNTPSLILFKKIGFTEVSRSDVFQEITLSLTLSPDTCQHLIRESPDYELCGIKTS